MVTNILSSPKVRAPHFAVMLLAFYFLVNVGAAKNLVTNRATFRLLRPRVQPSGRRRERG